MEPLVARAGRAGDRIKRGYERACVVSATCLLLSTLYQVSNKCTIGLPSIARRPPRLQSLCLSPAPIVSPTTKHTTCLAGTYWEGSSPLARPANLENPLARDLSPDAVRLRKLCVRSARNRGVAAMSRLMRLSSPGTRAINFQDTRRVAGCAHLGQRERISQ